MSTVLDAFQVGVAFDVVSAPSQSLLDGLGLRAEKAIGEALRPVVAESIAKSYAEGDSIVEAARAIRAKVTDVKTWKAVMLARTDLIGLANGASLLQARALNAASPVPIIAFKRWLATADNRTRETHAEAHGQEAPIDGDFMVGGFPMDYPGDPDGPDSEVISCRCSLTFLERPTVAASGSSIPSDE